ncbi:unnamed protein product [Cyprideis torosa]|uniref:Uncharacterized protein n=1 Tax=Cyprideis torosa TaxID=163714 RepID=A0A7R8WBR5_9CRUS|nr:unnamed protein product [Cyprideis torosa]CAG0892411.1 unnamed protein product [Cyprideis torosa]
MGHLIPKLSFKSFKDEALKNAYDWMDHLPCNASNEDIKDRYRELCLRYHPDKGGQQEDFQKLQCCMGVIKASKQDA